MFCSYKIDLGQVMNKQARVQRNRVAFLSLLLAAWPPAPAQPAPPAASAGLTVAPTRLVFDRHKRTGEVDLTNVGNAPGSYRVSLVAMEMDENGGMAEQPLDARPDADTLRDLVHFGPRLVALKPHEAQTVRVQIRRPADLPAGEYRVHLLVREEPAQAPETEDGPGPQALSIHLTSLFGVAIPLIIRQGETSATVKVARLSLAPDRKRLTFRLERSGNQSVYGNLKAALLAASGPPRVLAEVNGMSVYTPNAFRNVELALNPPAPAGTRIRVTYSSPEDQGNILIAEAVLDAP
jgi:P pilus assembly chaperone PapD